MMRRNVYVLFVVILAAVFAAAVSAQDVTLEPTLPVQTTVEATIQPPISGTSEATAEPTMAGTAESTAEMTAQPTAEATSQPTAEITAEMTTTPTDSSAYLRVAHLAPDADGVDVYLNGTIYYKKLLYQSISNWLAVDPGTYEIAVVPAGESVSSTVFAPVKVTADSGTWKTVAIVGSKASNTLQASVITEDYGKLLPSTGGFTFFNAVEGSKPVNLVKAGVVYFAQVGFPSANTSSSSSLIGDAGTFDVSAVDPDKPSTVFASKSGFEVPENGYTFLALVGTPGNEQFFNVVTDMSAVEIARGVLPEPGTLMDAMRADPNLTAFAQALQNAGLADMLNGTTVVDNNTTYTIFAPANFILDNTKTVDEQASALKAYIVKGKYTSKDLLSSGTLTALDGSTLKFTTNNNAIFVNSAQIIDLNVAATNGVIHMLNGHLP